MNAPDLEPLCVLDANEFRWAPEVKRDIADWLRHYGIDPDVTHRIEIYVFDTAFIRVYQWATDEHGNAYPDPGGDPDRAAQLPPFDVAVADLALIDRARLAAEESS